MHDNLVEAFAKKHGMMLGTKYISILLVQMSLVKS